MTWRTLTITLLLLLVVTPAEATTYVIQPDGNGDFHTIQEAIDVSSDGDSIMLADGTFTGDGNRDLDFQGRILAVCSESADPLSCIIDCEGSYAEPHRGFDFHSGEGAEALVQGITILHGHTQDLCPGCEGGGIKCEGNSSPTIRDCIFSQNTAGSRGGGLFCKEGSSPLVENCVFIENIADGGSGGGATALGGAAPSFVDCDFQSNFAGNYGGGIALGDSSSSNIENCKFIDNFAAGYGGGLSCINYSSAIIDWCLFADNSSVHWGGGLVCEVGSSPQISHCTFVRNSSYWGSGILCFFDCHPVVENSIIAFGAGGGAVMCIDGTATLACCDVYGNAEGDWVGCIADQEGIDGNISQDPLFCDLEADDLTLFSNSPCLPENNDCGELFGAYDQGCVATAIGDDSTPVVVLERNHPNPFNPMTVIAFTLSRAMEVELRVFDISGRALQTLLSARTLRVGRHTVAWDGRDAEGLPLPSGHYLYALRAGDEFLTGKMTLLK